jgi:regulator of sigma E protease
LVTLHELGHFIPAKLFKTRVEKFYLFFDIKYSLLKKKIGETEYGIGWLPLGGYVKISGMIDESMDKEQMALPPQPWEFRSKPTWQRLIIMLGGVTVNFILAFIIYIGMTFFYGEQYIANSEVKDGIWITNPVVEKAGLKTGDKLISIDGEKVERFFEANEKVLLSKEIVVLRDGKEIKVNFPINFIDQLMQGKRASLLELRLPFIVREVQDDSQNKGILKSKDIITSFNGTPIKFADEVLAAVDTLKGKTVPVLIKRDGKEISAALKVNDSAKLGIAYATKIPYDDLEKLGLYKVSKEEFGFFKKDSIKVKETQKANQNFQIQVGEEKPKTNKPLFFSLQY